MKNAPIPVLRTDRLVLRPITRDDAESIFSYASDPLVTRYVAWERHKSLEETLRYLDDIVVEGYRRGDYFDWGITTGDSDRLIGTCGFPRVTGVHGFAEMGYVLSRQQWGKGYVTEAARGMIRYGFETLGLKRIEALCRIENAASERVMQKAGMSFEGILRRRLYNGGAHHDVKIYSVINESLP